MTDPQKSFADRLLDGGTFIQYAGGHVMHPQPWAYTIGQTLLGRPEFLVTGLDEHEAKQLLTTAVDSDTESELAAGDMLTTHLGKVMLIEADSGGLYGAIVTFGLGRVRALQLVWDGDEHTQPLHAIGNSPFFQNEDGDDPYLKFLEDEGE